jgi:Family of unknown function (DUF6318)
MRLVRRRVLPLAAVALSAIVGLTAACTSGHGADPSTIPAPSGTPTTTPTVSPSPIRTGPLTTGPNMSPGEKPPAMSTTARQHTAAGALSFAQYYYRAFDWGYATNDPYLVQQISDQNCKACNRYITTLQALARAGGHVQNGRIRVKSARLTTGQFTVKSDYVADVMTDEEAVVVISPSSAPSTAEPPAMNDESLIFVSWRLTAWKVVEVGGLS